MNRPDDRSCGCPALPHPPPPSIPAGLSTLAERQLLGFPQYRTAMLGAIPASAALEGWRSRSHGDLGRMLLEAWAVVLDTVGFYDARVAERSYLGTAPDTATARKLTALIGHQPRPATAARIRLAITADGADPLELSPGTGFRTGAFGNEPPQVFELVSSHTVWPQRNRWSLAAVRDDSFDGTLRFLPRQAPNAGATLVLWSRKTSKSAAVRVASVDPEPAPDGITYQMVRLEAESKPGLAALIGEKLVDLQIAILRIAAPLFQAIEVEDSNDGRNENPLQPSVGEQLRDMENINKGDISLGVNNKTVIVLDGLYPQVRPGQHGVAEVNSVLHPVSIQDSDPIFMTLDPSTSPPARQAVTRVTIAHLSDSPIQFRSEPKNQFLLHIHPFPLAGLTRIAKTRISLQEIQGRGKLIAPVDLADAPGAGRVIARGATNTGVELNGLVIEDGDGQAHFAVGSEARDFSPLLGPVQLHGNVVEAIRGETVGDEVLGSGDSSRQHQRFKLKKMPLTWVEDASRAEGRRPELTVSVNGIAWTRTASFFGATAEDQIYNVTLDDDGASWITFGDGRRGSRLPSGSDNVHATYRFGAGAAKPPPGSIAQVVRPVKGLLTVISPLPASGGGDAERAADLRAHAPASALTLGRCVSLHDFEAMARAYDGVLNAAAGWVWDSRRQRAAAKLWIIADAGDPSAALADYLSKRAAPDLTIAVALAGKAAITTLAITLVFEDGHAPTRVRAAVMDALFNAETGFLAPKNQTIGGVIFRSSLSQRIHAVEGVAAIQSLLLDGVAMERGVAAGQGNWFDLQSQTMVS